MFDGNKNIHAKSPGIQSIGREREFKVVLDDEVDKVRNKMILAEDLFVSERWRV